MKKKDLLKEVAGVPTALKFWTDTITKVIINLLENEFSKGGDWDQEQNVEYKLSSNEMAETYLYRSEYVYEPNFVMDQIVKYSGFKDLKELTDSKQFREFPLFRFELKLNPYGFERRVYEKEMKRESGSEAALEVSPNETKIAKIGKKDVFTGVKLTLSPYLVEDVYDVGLTPQYKKELRRTINSSVAHELLHGYQIYNQLKSGRPAHFGREQVLNVLAGIPVLKSKIVDDWNDFLFLVYNHLSFEINARITQMYYQMKEANVKTKKDFLTYLKSTEIWREVERLENFDAKKLMDDINEKFSPFDLDPMTLFASIFSNEKMPETKGDVYKDLIGKWDIIIKQAVEHFEKEQGIEIPMEKVPEIAKKDPYHFFKFFEKRFHKKAKKFKRKLYKLASIVIEESVDKKNLIIEGDLDWIHEVPSAPNWGDKNFDLRLLDGFKFITLGVKDPIFSFCFNCTNSKKHTLIYDTAFEPLERTPLGDTNGAPWTWNEIRRMFLTGDWTLVGNIVESEDKDLQWIDEIVPSLSAEHLEVGETYRMIPNYEKFWADQGGTEVTPPNWMEIDRNSLIKVLGIEEKYPIDSPKYRFNRIKFKWLKSGNIQLETLNINLFKFMDFQKVK